MATYTVEVRWKDTRSGTPCSRLTSIQNATSPADAEKKAKEKIAFENKYATDIIASAR